MIIKNPLIIKKANLQSKTATPTTESQLITFDGGYDGLSSVEINAVTSAIDSNITPTNIRAGVTVLGVQGNLEPDKPDQSKTVTPTTSSQTITADAGYELASVTINPVTSSIDSNITADNIKKDVTILGVTGTLESGGGGLPEPQPTSSAFFTFDGANITGYKGSDENIILPKTYSKEIRHEYLDGLWCPREEYSNWFYRVSDMQEMEFFYNGESFFVYDSSVFDNLYRELEMRFPQGCYLTRARAGIYYAFDFLNAVASTVIINGQSFENGNAAFSFIAENQVDDVYFNGELEVVKYIDGTDYEVTGIAYGAFESNTTIKTVNILENILSIRGSAFSGCSSLTSIEIPNSVTSIETRTFNSCSSLTSVVIPDSVTSIKGWAFGYCVGLTSVIIGSGVTSIESGAFGYCRGLTSITIPSSVTSIGSYAFRDCSSLISVTISNGAIKIGESAFYNCTALSLIIMPDGVTSIGSNVFMNSNAVSVYVKDLGKWCSISFFGGNSNPLFSGGYLYVNYVLLRDELIIPNNVTQIKNYSFYEYVKLTSVTIPDSVTSIGNYAFYGCSGLTSMTIKSTTPPTLSSTNAISTATTKIYIPKGTLSAYQSATNWSNFASKFVELSA